MIKAVIFLFLYIPTFIFSQNQDDMVKNRKIIVTSDLFISSQNKIIWNNSLKKEVVTGHPFKINIKSKEMFAIVYITVYSKKYSHWVVISQAEVWYADLEKKITQYYQKAETLTIKKKQEIVFIPFNQENGTSNKLELKLVLRIDDIN